MTPFWRGYWFGIGSIIAVELTALLWAWHRASEWLVNCFGPNGCSGG